MAKKPSMKSNSSAEEDDDLDKLIAEQLMKSGEEDRVRGGPGRGSLPAIVRDSKGKVDPSATGRLSAKNAIDKIQEDYNFSESSRGKAGAKKNYNVPPQITEEDRRKAREEVARAKREMTSDSDVPASDKESMSKMIENEEGFKRGGAVRKYAEGGLVRGSVRGGGVALRGLGKGKVY